MKKPKNQLDYKQRYAQFVGVMNGDPAYDPRYPEYNPFEDTLDPPRKRRQHKPSVASIIKQAKKSGVSSVTLPDGTRFTFGEPAPTEASNPWLADLNKVTKQ